jgi:ADP-heptose:LPS heptosyltransferase
VKFILKTRSYKFDMVLYGHRSSVFAFILWLCGIKKRCGFRGTKFLTHAAEFNKDIPEYHRYLKILSECGFNADGLFPVLKKPLRETVRRNILAEPDSVLLGIFPMGGLNPGTEMDIKRWDIDNYFLFIQLLNKRFPEIKIILFEGKHATEKILIPESLGALKKVINNDIISCCDYFISGDTGSLHIAAAMDIPTLSLFGPSDPRLLAPGNNPDSGTRHIHIWKKTDCSPCYEPDSAIDKSNRKFWRSNEFICHTGTHICMKSITPEEVLDKFSELIHVNNSK